MAYCPNCGTELTDGMCFCPGCGQPAGSASSKANAAPEPIHFAPVERRDYSVILVSQGTATKTALRDLLEDMLGYTVSDARKLTNGMVMEVARGLTAEQAMYIAQALTEYGAQAAISTPSGFVDMAPMVGTSVFNRAGYFTAAVTASLAALTAMNRVSVFTPWMRGDVYRHVFAPRIPRAVPPAHVRRPRPVPPPRRAPAPPKPIPPRPAPPRASRPTPPRAVKPAAPRPPHPSSRPGTRGPSGKGPGDRR